MIMPNVMLENPPRDIRVDRDDEIKYKSLKDRFDLDNDKALFLIALNVGFFYDLKLELKTDKGNLEYNINSILKIPKVQIYPIYG